MTIVRLFGRALLPALPARQPEHSKPSTFLEVVFAAESATRAPRAGERQRRAVATAARAPGDSYTRRRCRPARRAVKRDPRARSSADRAGRASASIRARAREADPLGRADDQGDVPHPAKIGSGGMGDVYRPPHQARLAGRLKIVKPALLGHPAMVHRFQREARAASRLHHPNVVAVTDFGQSADGMLFMVMEYVAGKSLAQVIADEAPLSERRVVHIARADPLGARRGAREPDPPPRPQARERHDRARGAAHPTP